MKTGTFFEIAPDGQLEITHARGPKNPYPRIFPGGHRDVPPDENAIIARVRGGKPPRAKVSCVCNPPPLNID